jgi:hypothetical protein
MVCYAHAHFYSITIYFTWTLTKADERALGLFERKILGSLFGAVRDEGQWRRRYNFELYKLYDEPDLVKYIQINILSRLGM